jgi:hypothetical protein
MLRRTFVPWSQPNICVFESRPTAVRWWPKVNSRRRGLTRQFDETNPNFSIERFRSDASLVEAKPGSAAVGDLAFLGLVGLQVLPAAEMETAPSVLWFAAVQSVKRNQDLADLAPKGPFISAEAVERVIGQIGQT